MKSRLVSPLLWSCAALCSLGCVAAAKAPSRETAQVSFRLAYAFTAQGKTQWTRVVALVPATIPKQQMIEELVCRPEPLRLYEVGGNRYAEFFFVRPAGKFKVEITGRAKLLRYDLSVARAARSVQAGDLKPYLVDEPFLEKDDPKIAAAAAKLSGADETETVKRVYDFVMDRMTHTGDDLSTDGGDAVKALTTGKGDCTEYADLMVALCRAKGLPARHVIGLIDQAPDMPRHSWAEVYLRRHGWVPFDPTADDCSKTASFDRLPPRYLRFSTVRNDPVIENYLAYAVFRWWGDKVELSEEYEVRSGPANNKE
jgi:transglutaminase-like putative cysteine protease